jgi:flagellar FliJ protein
MSGPSYKFRLERVRALRERREDAARMELAGAMMRRAECEEQLNEAAAEVARARGAQVLVAPASAADLVARQAYLERMESAHRSTMENLRHHDAAVAGRRDALHQAARDRQALERLKAKGLAAHQREAARIEGITLDEIAINGYRRRAA